MRFSMAKQAQRFFSDIIPSDGSHRVRSNDKNKFDTQFDVYYCCAMIGMAAVQVDESTTDLSELAENYPKQYIDCRAQIAGLLVATEMKRKGIDVRNPRLEVIMLPYLSDNNTMLSDDGIKMLNAYAFKGYQLIHEYTLGAKPTSREEFLETFNRAIEYYQK